MNRLSLIVRAAACFLYFPLRGRARRAPTLPARMGVMQLSKLGDMVCTTPVFNALKRAGCEVVVVGNSINEALLAGHPSVSRYVVWRSQRLRPLKLDAVVLTAPSAEALAAAYLAGVPAIVCPRIENGSSPYETRLYRLLRSLCIPVPHRMGSYAPQEYLNMLRVFGIDTSDTTKTLAVSTSAREKIDRLLARYPHKVKVAVAPGAGNKIKEWPPERFGEVARWLAQKGALVVIVGAAQDKELAQIVKSNVPQESVLDTTGELSVEELKALVSRMSLFVSADTGPVYVAEAFNIPTVDITGPIDEREQPPIGSTHLVVAPKERARPELFVMNARSYDAREARRQAEDVQAARVIEAVDSLLKQ